MTFKCVIFAAAAAVAAGLVGCGKPADDKSGAPAENPSAPVVAADAGTAVRDEAAAPVDLLGKLFSSAEELYFGGQTNEAVKVLEDALGVPEYAADRRQIFSMLVRTELGAGLVDSARARMLAAYENDQELAEDACGAVFYHYSENGDLASAIAWTDEVLKIKTLTTTVRRNMREWNFLSCIAADEDERVVKLACGFVDDAPAYDAIRVLQRGADILVDRKKFDLISRILTLAGRTVTSDAGTRNFLATLRLRLNAEQGKWEEFGKNFAGAVRSFGDADLLYAMRRTLPLAVKARKFDVADAACMCVVTNGELRPMSYELAARQWVAVASKDDFSEIPVRIGFLLNRGKQVGEVCSLFVRYAYDGVDDAKFVSEMKPIGERLVPLAGDEDTRSAIRTVVLDFSFVLEDYDTAIKYLEAGFPGYDKNWHDMALSKVKAHKALKEGRPLDAIREFRAFMAVVQSSEEKETSDPATGVVHTREMILGRNAKRIGDIYASIPDAASAAAAYEEARAYYKQTLDTSTDPEVVDLVKKEMSQIPAK